MLEMLGAVRGVSSRTTPGYPNSMHQHERRYLIVPHEVATGVDCDGCLIVHERGDMADLKCNNCGAVIDTVPLTRAGPRLMELASSWSALSPHCV